MELRVTPNSTVFEIIDQSGTHEYIVGRFYQRHDEISLNETVTTEDLSTILKLVKLVDPNDKSIDEEIINKSRAYNTPAETNKRKSRLVYPVQE